MIVAKIPVYKASRVRQSHGLAGEAAAAAGPKSDRVGQDTSLVMLRHTDEQKAYGLEVRGNSVLSVAEHDTAMEGSNCPWSVGGLLWGWMSGTRLKFKSRSCLPRLEHVAGARDNVVPFLIGGH